LVISLNINQDSSVRGLQPYRALKPHAITPLVVDGLLGIAGLLGELLDGEVSDGHGGLNA
jgi:hypothetical protein